MVWAVVAANALTMPMLCVSVCVCVRWWEWRGQADMTGIISVMESNQISKRN